MLAVLAFDACGQPSCSEHDLGTAIVVVGGVVVAVAITVWWRWKTRDRE